MRRKKAANFRRKRPAKITQPLKAIGYWGPERVREGDLPDPADLVDPQWLLHERVFVASYLRAGQVYAQWRGGAECRLCPVQEILGSTDLTDGEWVWPVRLEHYIERHHVCLPDEFIGTMRLNSWQVPCDPDKDWDEDRQVPDHSLWIAWAAQFNKACKRGVAVEEGSGEVKYPRQKDGK